MNFKVRITFFVAFSIVPFFVFAQQADTATTSLNEVLLNTYKFPEKRKKIAQTSVTINNKSAINFQANVADVLINSGEVFVQKSQQGGGSPVIRGFEASRVLLMVDGVRLNNAIYRTGHLQNIITVDNMILDRIDVLYGPSSTLYGSDALGGVVIMNTKNPLLSTSNKTQVTGSATARYSNAIEEARTNVQFNIGTKQFASLTSITYGSFGDVIQGNNRLAAYPNFGLKNFIVQRINNIDSAIANTNPNRQSPSGYKQIDVLQKFLFQPDANTQHLINVQCSNADNIPRYDRLSEVSNGRPAFAEWFYGDQLRNMISYQFNKKNINGFFSEFKLVANYQSIKESRITRRFKNNNRDSRWEQLDIFGITIDAKHLGKKYELHIGAESYTNFVSSTAERLNIVTGLKSRIQTRYSDGPTNMASQSIYAQHIYKFNENLTLNSGIRFNYVSLNARFADTAIMRLPFNSVEQRNFAVTGNLGLVYATQNSKLAAIASSGFRSPNVDDLSKVFETNIGRVIVPNINVKPEYTYNAEVSYNHYGKKLNFGANVFYTWFLNAIAVDNFTFNGQDSITYNGVRSVVVAPQNKATAFVNGFSLQAGYKIFSSTSINAVYTYTYGRFNNLGLTVPLDHVPPSYGRVGILHKQNNWQAEVFSLFNGWKKLKDYSPSGEDNLQYATADGMPSWATLNVRFAATITKQLQLQASIDNVFDLHYRYFASGISAPGTNLMLSVKYSF